MESGTGTTFVNPQTQVPLSTAFQVAAAASSIHTSANSVSQFQDAIMSRIGRSFGFPPGCDLKELGNLQFSGAGVNSVRPDGLVGFPILPHMVSQPSLFHHLVDSRISSAAAAAASAFRPFMNCSPNIEGPGKGYHPSAFQAPRSQSEQQKRLSSPTLFSPGQNLYPNNSTVSVTSSTPSPTCKRFDENSNSASKMVVDRHDSISPISAEGSSIMDDNIADHSAKRTRYSLADGECCPICGLHLAHSEIEAHYKKELEILSKVSEGLIQKLPFNTIEGADVNHSGFRSQTHHQHHHSNQHHSEQQIHHQHPQHHHHQQHAMEPLNKQHMSAKNPLEIAPRSRWDTFQRIQRNRQSRIRVKLSRRAGKRPDEILEEEGHEPPQQLEEQQHRQKMQTQHRKLGPAGHNEDCVHSNDNTNDDDIDIVSCDKNNSSLSSTEGPQDWHIYGPVQYTEADVLACVSDAEKENNEEANTRDGNDSQSNNSNSNGAIESIELLRLKVEELERLNRCSKCQEPIQKPVVNISCWHIKCETCWLRTLGTSKCCTVCGVKSVPADLRKVYVN